MNRFGGYHQVDLGVIQSTLGVLNTLEGCHAACGGLSRRMSGAIISTLGITQYIAGMFSLR